MSSKYDLNPGVTMRQLSSGPGYHFFGYYDKSPWDASGRRVLGMRAGFMDRPPRPDDELELIAFDASGEGEVHPFARTSAWNWQQGCMLQWLAGGKDDQVIYNDRENGRFVSRIHNLRTGEVTTLLLPIYAVDPAGERAVTTSFARLHHQRPGYGYAGIADPWRDIPAPADDGIFAIDLKTGETKLIISLAQIACCEPSPDFAGRLHRFNHLQFSRDGKRFVFLHRYKKADEPVGITRLFTANADGSDLRLLSDHGMVSHFDWCPDGSLIAWAHRKHRGAHFYRFSDGGGDVETVGEMTLDCDGHCSFSPDGAWLLTDSYPDADDFRSLILYRPSDNLRVDLGRFFSPPGDWEIRCDLHPRWHPNGRSICIDSAHEGSRKMYVLNLQKIIVP